jgi:hypothetical protein
MEVYGWGTRFLFFVSKLSRAKIQTVYSFAAVRKLTTLLDNLSGKSDKSPR